MGNKLTGNINSFFEQIPGLIMIDNSGIVFYVNQQCADYFGKSKDEILYKHINDTFPDTKMIEGLKRDEPAMVFYNSSLGIGISYHVPLYLDDKKVGLMEYDVAQSSAVLYELSDEYNHFLDKELSKLQDQIIKLEGTKYSINNIVGSSPSIKKLKSEIISSARTASTVMITGETGTGKELVAHAIHNLSNRRKHRMIKINSAAIPDNLFESELFGYEKGSFTGASVSGKKGKIELANHGTLFIDEINHLPLAVQPKLLRVLQEKEVDRIGSDKPLDVDIRIIAATNQDLQTLVKQGKFREDLYYRLNVLEIKVPPLRKRLDDIGEISTSIIGELNHELGVHIEGIDAEAIEYLKTFSWPGNVRELRNSIEKAMNYTSGNKLTLSDFEFELCQQKDLINSSEMCGNIIEITKNNAERELIQQVLLECANNKTQAAARLHISRPLLYQKMKRLRIDY